MSTKAIGTARCPNYDRRYTGCENYEHLYSYKDCETGIMFFVFHCKDCKTIFEVSI